ncbi:MAG: hypothetical protein ACAH82_00875 [Solirubrobacteraceae bacterium]
MLLSGERTDGRFAMLDMLSPPGGGPPPYRHDLEECFREPAGSIEMHLRDPGVVRSSAFPPESGSAAQTPTARPEPLSDLATSRRMFYSGAATVTDGWMCPGQRRRPPDAASAREQESRWS